MAQAENGQIKVRLPKIRKSQEEVEAERIAIEEAEKKAEKLEDIGVMLTAYSAVAYSVGNAHVRTEHCTSLKARVGAYENPITPQEFALDIVGTKAALKKAYSDMSTLDAQIKSMRMNPWKKIICSHRSAWFDQLHADTLLIESYVF